MPKRPPVEVVYLVEDHTIGPSEYEAGSTLRYWSKVYLSVEKAMAGVEHWAAKGGKPVTPLRWENGGFGAHFANAPDGRTAYTVVGLAVHHDDVPEGVARAPRRWR